MNPISENIVPEDPIERMKRSTRACEVLEAFAQVIGNAAESIMASIDQYDVDGAAAIIHNLIVLMNLTDRVGPIGIFHGIERGLTEKNRTVHDTILYKV